MNGETAVSSVLAFNSRLIYCTTYSKTFISRIDCKKKKKNEIHVLFS